MRTLTAGTRINKIRGQRQERRSVKQEGSGRDQPIKENDHAMDDMRYFVGSLEEESGCGFAALSI